MLQKLLVLLIGQRFEGARCITAQSRVDGHGTHAAPLPPFDAREADVSDLVVPPAPPVDAHVASVVDDGALGILDARVIQKCEREVDSAECVEPLGFRRLRTEVEPRKTAVAQPLRDADESRVRIISRPNVEFSAEPHVEWDVRVRLFVACVRDHRVCIPSGAIDERRAFEEVDDVPVPAAVDDKVVPPFAVLPDIVEIVDDLPDALVHVERVLHPLLGGHTGSAVIGRIDRRQTCVLNNKTPLVHPAFDEVAP